ncbi:hypothetical protein [Metabacillus fastidiosus]|uniref:hypothetical protein n=1 Tax=Metabacillus fastidiosus TaxID=1458 RepID=UPI002E1DAF23|nr:hypothetical protein [Metabacillus fastidiosus]
MDNILLQKLTDELLSNWENRDVNIKLCLNSLLKKKSNKTVILDLTKAIERKELADKNKAVVIVTLALIRRNLDCDEEVRELLRKYNLINLLYGGLIKLLDGRANTFKIQISWSYNTFENKYEFIERFPVPEQRRFIDLITVASILIKEDVRKFESILIKDSTDLLLLNFLHGEEDWIISEELINTLLKDETSGLRRSIGFYILIKPIDRLFSKSLEIRREKINFNKKVEKFKKIFKDIPVDIQAELLINYFLTNKRAKSIPPFLAKQMVHENLKDSMVSEIKSNKIRNLDDIYILLFIIKSFRSKSHCNKSYKNSLYDALLKKIIEFIENNKGIYFGDENAEKLFGEIYRMFPKQYRNNLEKNILKTRENLMISKLDELVRFKLFLNDSSRASMINEMLKTIENIKRNY